MRFVCFVAAAAIAVCSGSDAVQAQSSGKLVPAEFPPSSFDGRQYVDSKGCVFIRAGVDGAVNWVPRMTRGREQVCGFQPTLSAQARAEVVAPRATAATTTQPATQPARTAPKPVTYARATPPKPVSVAPTSYRSAPAQVAAPTAPAPLPIVVNSPATDTRSVVGNSCQGATPLSTQYINSTTRYPIRCGPQSAPHVTYADGTTTYRAPAPATAAPLVPGTAYTPGVTYVTNTGTAGQVYYRSAEVRVAPRHVYEQQLAARDGVSVPPGYAPIWEDDRLNPQRAHQTFAGKAQMERIWTRTTPRRLILKDAGPAVTPQSVAVARAATPTSGYAYSSAAGGKRKAAQTELFQITSHPSERTQRADAPKSAPRTAERTEARATVSTRSTPGTDAPRAASHRYVQLGAFEDADHAKRTAQQMANSGMPARMGKVTRNGQSYTLVLAGPFDTQAQLDAGLARVRNMGFSGATLRR